MPHVALSEEEKRREARMLQELKKMQREGASYGAPLASVVTKKRIRIPQINTEKNPFCMERQLADEYELQNFNKASHKSPGASKR